MSAPPVLRLKLEFAPIEEEEEGSESRSSGKWQ
jgi:hypothetical protein